MHYNTVYKVLAIFTLFATATAGVVPPPTHTKLWKHLDELQILRGMLQ